MITLQILNKILATGDLSMVERNTLTDEYFRGYEEEFNFITNHYKQYGNVPDKATFIDRFQQFEFIEVAESNQYLLDGLFEENLYYKSVEVVQTVAKLLKADSNEAVEYLHSKLGELTAKTVASGVDIISQAQQRYDVYIEKQNYADKWYIPTGFEELDGILYGWCKEDLIVLFARTGQGKSWVLTKTLAHAWTNGYRVGYISPEMTAVKVGYRFDTVCKHFSNQSLNWGRNEEGYRDYIAELRKEKVPFIISTPLDFQKKITVTKIKQFIQANKLQILGIDGITYLTDERRKTGDNKTITLTNISEDLVALSLELGVPIIVVVQSNRSGVKNKEEEGTPELESIRDSDGISHNATKVISLRQSGAGLEFGIKKHRDGTTGDKLIYYWDIDKGIFSYVPSSDDGVLPEKREERVREIKDSLASGVDLF